MDEMTSRDDELRSPASVLRPTTIAIVGASERAIWPKKIFNNLRTKNYPAHVYPVNPKLQEVWGVACYPDLASLPEPPEHAIVIVPAPAVQGVLEIGVKAGLKSATVYADGLGEGTDAAVVARGTALRELVARSGLRLCGPNCMGVNSLHEGFFGYPNDELCLLKPGSVAFLSQSGGTINYFGNAGSQRGLKFSYLVSSGNEMSLDVADYTDHFVQDENTKLIALFIEGIRRPHAFMKAAAKALALRKPIIALKSGKSASSREAAKTHTGVIAGDYKTFLAMCDRYGIVVCDDLDELIETTLAFQASRLPKGPRVGWITTSGGTLDLLFDALDEHREIVSNDFGESLCAKLHPYVKMPRIRNPLDAGNPQTDDSSAAMCAALASDSDIDMIGWCATTYKGAGKRDAAKFRRFVDETDKPVIAFSRMNFASGEKDVDFQNESGIPFLQGIPRTVKAMAALSFYSERAGRTPLTPNAPHPRHETFTDVSVVKLLEAAKIPTPRSRIAKSEQETITAALQLGLPVALKIVSPDVSHKTEAGGIHLDLRSVEEVERAARALFALEQKSRSALRVEGVQVQEMISSGVEMVVGVRSDPLYGPIMVIGAGGVLVELVEDVAIGMLPIEDGEVRKMIGRLKTAKLLEGYRGNPRADIDALVSAVCRLSDAYLSHNNALTELEINPLIVRPYDQGVCAVDVRWSVAA